MPHLCPICIATLGEVEKPLPESEVPEWFRPSLGHMLKTPSPKPEWSYVHHKNTQTLENSAEAGCYICTVLRRGLVAQCGCPLSAKATALNYKCHVAVARGSAEIKSLKKRLFLIFIGNGLDDKYFRVAFDVLLEANQDGLGQFNSDGTLAHQPIQQARAWLAKCLGTHPDCRKSGSGLPSRLVKVRRAGNQVSAKLCLSSELPPWTDYLTLSHCWGTTSFFTLTEANFSSMLQSIPVDELPVMFQDAFSITAQLGYEYIWIDSLCIIQDSPGSSDWLEESARMHHVYGNSVCNLAATGFSDGSQGLLSGDRGQDLSFPSFRFDKLFKHLNVETSEECHIISTDNFRREIVDSPLHQRAWVIQEQVLAPRILHFTKTQMYWECDYAVPCSEALPSYYSKFLFYDNIKKLTGMTANGPRKDHARKDYMYRGWRYLVRAYSRCHLTCPLDKLPALSGLAKVYRRHLKDDYLAGLWRGDLLRGMLWHRVGVSEHEPALTEYRAPSWSWASVDGPVSHIGGFSRLTDLIFDRAEVLDAVVDAAGPDNTGLLRGGYIRLAGELHQVCFVDRPGAQFASDFQLTVKEDGAGSPRMHLEYVGPVFSPTPLIRLQHSTDTMKWNDQFFLMPLLGYSSGFFDIIGIVLRTSDMEPGTHVKVGTFTSSTDHWQTLTAQAASPEREYYEDKDEKGRFIVKIV